MEGAPRAWTTIGFALIGFFIGAAAAAGVSGGGNYEASAPMNAAIYGGVGWLAGAGLGLIISREGEPAESPRLLRGAAVVVLLVGVAIARLNLLLLIASQRAGRTYLARCLPRDGPQGSGCHVVGTQAALILDAALVALTLVILTSGPIMRAITRLPVQVTSGAVIGGTIGAVVPPISGPGPIVVPVPIIVDGSAGFLIGAAVGFAIWVVMSRGRAAGENPS